MTKFLHIKRLILVAVMALGLGFGAMAQSTYPIVIEVKAVTGVRTQGLVVELNGEESGWVFDPVKVNADGIARFPYVPEGVFTLTVDGTPAGLERYVDENLVVTKAETFTVTLNEAVRTPYALNAVVNHNDFTGVDSATVTWNRETDYFFDDFESYEPFAVEFAPWTGHDLDKEPAAEIQGYYPNRGTQQYATIFNALTIDPPVYYEYEVLRPYSGKQYVGFVRTRSGNANNDWLISPKIKVGVNNIVSFMAKAAEYTPDRFAVCISTKGTEVSDFVQLTPGNYETVDYKYWHEIVYDLSRYEGQEVYIAIHCMSQNSFMLMVDDFYVGPSSLPKMARKANRVGRRSAENPNESFVVTLDGTEMGVTEEYEFIFGNISAGQHTVGIQAKYMMTESDLVTLDFNVPGAGEYAALKVKMSVDNGMSLDGQKISLLNTATARQTILNADAAGTAEVGYLAKGDYMLNIVSDYFDEYNSTFTLDGDKTLEISLNETITDPFNLMYQFVGDDEKGCDVELWWNQDLGFRESFEEYDDFTQRIGDWTVLDLDAFPTYAFSIGGVNITKPEQRGLVGAMVFNPYSTEPVQASDDGLFIAPDGDKYVMFNSAEVAQSDDWLISPELRIGADYVLRFTAKSYTTMYPGVFEFCTLKDNDIVDVEVLDYFQLTDEWMRYEISLRHHEGESLQIAFHHLTFDGWLSFIDDVYVGPGDESTGENPATANCTYDIYLDGEFLTNVSEPYCRFENLSAGTHTAGIQAIYPSGKRSNISEITFTVNDSGVITVGNAAGDEWRYFNINGLEVQPSELLPSGVYIRTNGQRTEKIIR